MIIKSLDPRIIRAELESEGPDANLNPLAHFETWEVFHQKKRGAQHVHVGVVHAPNPEIALLYGKEQYSRRGQTANLWVVKSSEVFATDYEDEDIFQTTPDKFHRDPGSYKVMDRIQKFKENQKS